MMYSPKSPVFHFDGDKIVLDEDITFQYSGKDYTIKKGYESDGASVPRFLWRILSPQYDPTTIVPSIIHDYLYGNKIGTRKDADEWYYKSLRDNGYSWFKSKMTYCGLRLFGGCHWGEK